MVERRYDKHGNQNYYRAPVSNRKEVENLAGAFDENFKVRIDAFIDGEDFCNAVRRCLIHDLLAGLMDEDDDDHKRRRY